MITLTVSFKPDGSNAEVIAQVFNLLAGLENSVAHEANTEEKQKKTRKVRVYTDADKAAFRARMVEAREAKAKAKQDADVDTKADSDLDKKSVEVETELVTTIKPVMPRTSRKVGAKPSTQ